VRFTTEERESENVVGILKGADPKLSPEYAVLSAHLDHVGVGKPIDGDEIYNGAMDNASGVATLIETARVLRESGTRPRRSIIFLAVTGEEKGLLGSRHYAAHPTVPEGSIIANLNNDMFSPFFPLKSLVVQGLEESDLASDLKRASAAAGVEALGSRAGAKRLRKERSIQFHPRRDSRALAQGGFCQRLAGTRDRESLAEGALPCTLGRPESARGSRGGGGVQPAGGESASRDREPREPAELEPGELLQALRQRTLSLSGPPLGGERHALEGW
jgi:hypothetical protein